MSPVSVKVFLYLSLWCHSLSHGFYAAPQNPQNVASLLLDDDGVSRDLPKLLTDIKQVVEFENFKLNPKKTKDASSATARAVLSGDDLMSNPPQVGTCQLVPIIHFLKHPGCQLKAISSFACVGACLSYVQTSPSKFWQHERSCSCCQQTGSQEATFTLDCPSLDPPYRKVKTHAPVDCMCRACTSTIDGELRPQELVEALAGEAASGKKLQW